MTNTQKPVTQTMEDLYVVNCDLCCAAQAVMTAVVELPDEPHHESLNEAVEHVPLEDIAKQFQVPMPLLKRRLGIGAKRTAWTPTMIRQLAEDFDSGMTVEEVAAKWDLSKSRVNQVIAKHEIDVTKGRRERARREAARFQEVSDAVFYLYDLEPDLTREAIFAWVSKNDLVPDGTTFEEVSDVITRLGLTTGTLDAMPNVPAPVVDKADEWVEDHDLPSTPLPKAPRATEDHDLPDSPMVREAKASIALDQNEDGSSMTQAVDDVVVVPEKTPLEWLKMWLEEDPGGTIEDYAHWAQSHEGAPSTTEIREEYGSWGQGKAAALA